MKENKFKNFKIFTAAFFMSLLIIGGFSFGVYLISGNSNSAEYENTDIILNADLNKNQSIRRKLANPFLSKNILFILADKEDNPIIFYLCFFNSKIYTVYIPESAEYEDKTISEIYRKKGNLGILNVMKETFPFETDYYIFSYVDDFLSLPFLPFVEYNKKLDEKFVFDFVDKVILSGLTGNSEYNYRYLTDKCKTDFSYYDFIISKENIENFLSSENIESEKFILKINKKGEN